MAAVQAEPPPQPHPEPRPGKAAKAASSSSTGPAQWIRPGVQAIFADVVAAVAPEVAAVRHRPTKDQVMPLLRSLGDIPAEMWERVPEPPSGYHYRMLTECGASTADTLLDGGAVYSCTPEEYFIEVVNEAISAGLSPASPNWPIAGLQEWGEDVPASTMSQGPALS